MSDKLFSSYTLGRYELKNRLVMAPMTRCRAIGNIPNELMATYYGQRASAGLIVTEGTSPSPNGLGYARIPGIYSQEQVEGWKLVTDAVHKEGGRIFVQLMHTGRVGHTLNLPEGAEILAPSAVAFPGQMYTDQEGPQDHPLAREMTPAEVEATVEEYVHAAKNAVAAGFDGIELHGANGYLIEQFIHPHTNQRTDEWGGSMEKRARFALEVARRTAEAIGKDRVGIRLSPYGIFNDMPHYPEIDEMYTHLAKELGTLGIAYLHLVDHSAGGAPEVPDSIKTAMQGAFSGTFILSGGYDATRAEADLQAEKGDLVAFGKPFISNPNLVERFQSGADLNAFHTDTFYTPGPKGYTDYPVLAK